MTATDHPVEFVRALPDERKEEVFFALLEDIYAGNSALAPIPLKKGGTDLGYLVPPRGTGVPYEDFLRTLPADVAEKLRQPIPDDLDFDDVIPDDEINSMRTAARTRTGR